MRRVLDALFTAVALLLIVPTTLILASWNAIPGDRLYSLKSSLEDTVLLVFSGTPLVPEVSIKFTEKRFNEATRLLAKKGSTVGYDLLVAEAKQTQGYISKKKDSQSGTQFIQKIEAYQKEIEQKKAEVVVGSEARRPEAPTVVPSNTPPVIEKTVTIDTPQTSADQISGQQITVSIPTVVVITQESPEAVVQKLEDTERKLKEIKKEVEDDIESNSEGTNEEKNKENELDKDKKDKDEGD